MSLLKYLTPSVALEDSRLSGPLYISASPTSRFFSVGPRIVSSSTVGTNHSSMNSSYLNRVVDPLKSGGIFVVIPIPAVYCYVDSARYAPTNDSSYSVCRCDRKSPNLPHCRSLLGLLKFSSNTHSRGTLFTTRSSTFTTQQPRSAATLWLSVCSRT